MDCSGERYCELCLYDLERQAIYQAPTMKELDGLVVTIMNKVGALKGMRSWSATKEVKL
jgi:hypothetical protein